MAREHYIPVVLGDRNVRLSRRQETGVRTHRSLDIQASSPLKRDFLNTAMIVDTRNCEEKEKALPFSDSRKQISRRASYSVPESTNSLRGPIPKLSVDQIHLQTGSKPLIGSFYIDPRVHSLASGVKAPKTRNKKPPHASFRTRGGMISLDLGTTGDVKETPKAAVLVTSNTGNITINLLSSLAIKPRIELEVFSRRGDVILFLPDTFCGMIQLSTRRGRLQFLPAMIAFMRVLNQTDDEALILLGNQTLSKSDSYDNQALDFCHLSSGDGRLIMGLGERDRLHEPKVGF